MRYADLQALSFAAAGPGFVVLLGLFVAGGSVTAGFHQFIPRWLMWLGIFVAAACELASLTLLTSAAGYFIPVGRFISIVWMIAIATTLRHCRRRAIEHEGEPGVFSNRKMMLVAIC